MHYASFIRLLEHIDVDYSQPEDIPISRAKKLVQAEFAMQTDGLLSIDGIDYNKNDVLQEFEHPEFPSRLAHHNTIWKHPELLELLERDAIDIPKSYRQWFHLHEDEEFKTFLSPYFAGAYNSVMKSLLHAYDFAQAEMWQRFHVFLSPEDEDKAYHGTRLFLDDAISLYKNINSQTYLSKMTELHYWESRPWGPFINKLPDPLFYFIDEVAIQLINFTVTVQKLEKPMCVALSEQLCFLTRASPDLKKIIIDNHQVYKGNASSDSSGGSGLSGWNWIWIVIVLMKIIFSMGTCSNISPSTKIDSLDTVRFKIIMDSLHQGKVIKEQLTAPK